MPGHVKKSSGPDPDPSHWLYVSHELKDKMKVRTLKSETLIAFVKHRLSPMIPKSRAGCPTKPLEALMKG